MSFSSTQKTELIKMPIKNACCRRAMLHGVLCAKGELCAEEVHIRLGGDGEARFVASLVREFFGKEPTFSTGSGGGRGRLLTFQSPAAVRYLTDLFATGEVSYISKCTACQAHFLRGIFLAGGRVSDPTKQYCLEFSLEKRENILLKYFESIGLYPKLSTRRSETLLYFKNSTMIEDFFTLAGMHATAFLLMNAKIEHQLRYEANRHANCETNNIQKSVSSSRKYLAAIERLDEARLLSSLPPELEETARMRLLYHDLSLPQLASKFTPAITKSGLTHRLSRILVFANELLGTGKI